MTRTSAPLLRAEALAFGLLPPLTLSVGAGECVALWGPSGSGKTRLLRALADLDPNSGAVWLNNRPREDFPGHEWRRRVALLPAEAPWWLESVGEHLATDTPTAALSALGFERDVLDWQVNRLSTGEKQRLALIRLLHPRPVPGAPDTETAADRAGEPPPPCVLLLDEPTANLDTRNTERVEQFLAEQRRQGRGLLWVSHDPEQRHRVADRAYTLRDGRMEVA